jgi:hypothetical protein
MFDEAKQQMMATGTPSDGFDLDGMSIDFDAYLSTANLFEHVAVHQTGDTHCMLLASCRVAPGGTPTTVGEALVGIWQNKLRYHSRAAHRLRQDDLGVYLDVATLSDSGIFVTGQIAAMWQARP